jgi:Fur family transcriptional regulator, ferric uptake regulator
MNTRRTRSQDRIVEVLKLLKEAISAQALYVELRNRKQSMGLATVYRALEALKLEGAVQVRTIANGEALYSLVQEDRHHLTCVQCGESLPIDGCPVHDLEMQLHQAYNFKIYYHMLEFFGLCTQCQAIQGQAMPDPSLPVLACPPLPVCDHHDPA